MKLDVLNQFLYVRVYFLEIAMERSTRCDGCRPFDIVESRWAAFRTRERLTRAGVDVEIYMPFSQGCGNIGDVIGRRLKVMVWDEASCDLVTARIVVDGDPFFDVEA